MRAAIAAARPGTLHAHRGGPRTRSDRRRARATGVRGNLGVSPARRREPADGCGADHRPVLFQREPEPGGKDHGNDRPTERDLEGRVDAGDPPRDRRALEPGAHALLAGSAIRSDGRSSSRTSAGSPPISTACRSTSSRCRETTRRSFFAFLADLKEPAPCRENTEHRGAGADEADRGRLRLHPHRSDRGPHDRHGLRRALEHERAGAGGLAAVVFADRRLREERGRDRQGRHGPAALRQGVAGQEAGDGPALPERAGPGRREAEHDRVHAGARAALRRTRRMSSSRCSTTTSARSWKNSGSTGRRDIAAVSFWRVGQGPPELWSSIGCDDAGTAPAANGRRRCGILAGDPQTPSE